MSLRLRLTLLITGLVLVVLAGFSSALYLGQARSARRALAGALIGATRPHMARPERSGGLRLAPFAERARPPILYLQTRDVEGTVIDRALPLGDDELPLSAAGLEAVRTGRPWIEEATVGEDRLLVYSAPLAQAGEVAGVLQAAGSIDLAESYLRGLRNSLVVISLLTAALAFAGGWFLSGEALRPLDRITRTAAAIGSERDFGKRLERTGPNDELARLARTFNEMLAELQQSYVSVEEALRTQRRFVADASHELRTPLTTVRGNAELLRLEPPIGEADREAAVGDIVAETDRLIDLVGKLLVLARADAGHEPRRERVEVRPLLVDLVRQAHLLSPEREVTLAGEADLAVVGDPDAVRQVVSNALDNALRHTPVSARIEVSAEAAGDSVAIVVRDDGPGIDPELLPKVFERFQRGHPSRTGPGTGLGLSIARSLTEAQGGSIEIDSEPSRGTTVTVRLPRA